MAAVKHTPSARSVNFSFDGDTEKHENSGNQQITPAKSLHSVGTGSNPSSRQYRSQETIANIEAQKAAGRLTPEQAQEMLAKEKLKPALGKKDKSDDVKNSEYKASANEVLGKFIDGRDELTTSPALMAIFRRVGIDKIHQAAVNARKARRQPEWKHPCPLLEKLVGSTAFELVVAIAMIGNGILIGVAVSLIVPGETSELDAIFELLEHIFTAFFVIEVILRVAADGWQWLWSFGNAADVGLIVMTGVLPMWILGPLSVDPGMLRVFAVLRVLRLIRLVKMVRTKPMFRIFWSLIQGILDSGKTLMYTYVMITMVLYVFAIFSVYLIARDKRFEDDEVAQGYFGDVPSAMFTLFQIITLDSWAEVSRPLMKKSAIVAPFVIAVIGVVTLVLLNLVIAVIVNNAFERAQKDEDLQAEEKRKSMQTEILSLQELFKEIDTSGDNMLSKEEYNHALQHNDAIRTKFELLGVEPREYDEIWQLLDDSKEGKGEVSIASFAYCLRDMKGGAKAKDSFTILRKVQTLNTKLARLSESLNLRRRFAEELRMEAAGVRKQLGSLQYDMCEFVQLIGDCIPTAPVKVSTDEIQTHMEGLQDRMKVFL